MPAPHLLTLDDLVERFGWDRHRIMSMVRAEPVPTFPPPMNIEQSRGYRWHIRVVESYELGEWRPATPGLRAVS